MINSNIFSLLTFLVLSTKNIAPDKINPSGWNYILKSDSSIILNVPFVHQIDDLTEQEKTIIRSTACGPAALTMLFKFHGKDTNLSEVISKLPNSVYVKGQRFYNLAKGPEYFSMKAAQIEKSPNDIFEILQKGEPIILNVQNYDGITGHALVIVGMLDFDGEKASALIVHDPYVGPYRQFPYESEEVLRQPEGYLNYLGIMNPFYIEPNQLVLK